VPSHPAQAINLPVPEPLQWEQEHQGSTYQVTSVTVRLLPDGHLAAKAYGRVVGGRTAAYVGLPVELTPQLRALVDQGIAEAAHRWLDNRGFPD
jgi:hypothetical protein